MTLNSDDPPMFGTTLTDEYLEAAATFGFERPLIETLVLNAARATLLEAPDRADLVDRIQAGFDDLMLLR